MARLSDEQYAEYVELLKAWVEADKTVKGLQSPDAAARERATQAYAAVQSFRDRYGLDGHERALERSAREAR
jgi:hypothetical protein